MAKNLKNVYLNIILVGIFVLAANAAAVKFNRHWDVTSLRLHTLTPETQTFLLKIEKPIRLTVFYAGTVPRYLKDLLSRYEKSSNGRITAEIIDPLRDLGYAAQFGTTIDKNETKVFLRSDNKSSEVDFTKDVLTQDLLNFGILRLNRSVKTACFTAGHEEYKLDSDKPEGLEKFKKRLMQQNIDAREIVLGVTPQIPEVCDALVIAGPHGNFTPPEEEAVKAYLNRGGDALILVENVIVTTPDVPLSQEQENLNPSLDGILTAWGLRAGKDIVVDLSSHISGDPGTPATRNYMKHPALIKDLDYTFFVRPRSVSLVHDRRKDIKLAPFVLSSSKTSSWAETNRQLEVKYDPGIDTEGPVAISYVVWGPRPNPQASDTRMIVFTDADFLSNVFIDQFSNGQLAMNIMNWLVDVDFENDLTSKNPQEKVQRLNLTSRQKFWVGTVLAAMPLLLLILGIVVGLRRRR